MGQTLAESDVMQSQPDLIVMQVGLGKAGVHLHAGPWEGLEDLNVSRIGYDIDPEKRRAAREAGMLVLDSLDELPESLAGKDLGVVDNTTASGYHASSTEDVLSAIDRHGLSRPQAWILEKPVISRADEKPIMESTLDEIGRERVFVNENYLASKALAQATEIIAAEQASGNGVTKLVVDFSKDRAPDVILRGRFQDPKGLAVYGIEMPHMLAIASSLLGVELDTRDVSAGGDIVTNKFFHDIDGIEASEGNYTRLQHEGISVILKQPLGPFEISDDGALQRHEWGKNVFRTAKVTFADGRGLTISFDPVPGIPRYYSKVEHQTLDGGMVEVVMSDNTLHNLIGSVAVFAQTRGEVESPLLKLVTPQSAMRYAEQLAELRVHAGSPVKVDSLASAEDTETAEEFSRRVVATYS